MMTIITVANIKLKQFGIVQFMLKSWKEVNYQVFITRFYAKVVLRNKIPRSLLL